MSKNQNVDEEFDSLLGAEYRWQVVLKNPLVQNDPVHADNVSIDRDGAKFYLKNGVLVYFTPYDLIETVFLDEKNGVQVHCV